jgi:uncharacterized membrane protein YadS
MAGEIISERRARSNRIGGRHHLGFAGDFPRNPQYGQTSNADCGEEPACRQALPKPWFVGGFVAMMLFNSLNLIPPAEKAYLTQTTTFLLTVALAAMGLETDVGKLRAKGCKPLLVGAGSWLFISAFSFCLIELIYH